MKVQGSQRLPGAPLKNSGSPASSVSKTGAQGGDRVTLSGSKGEAAQIKAQLALVPDAGVEKIPAIRQQISDGTYHVEARDVAASMLDRWKEFPRR